MCIFKSLELNLVEKPFNPAVLWNDCNISKSTSILPKKSLFLEAHINALILFFVCFLLSRLIFLSKGEFSKT